MIPANIKSVGQYAAKLLLVIVEVLKKKSATLAIPAEERASAIDPDLNRSRVIFLTKVRIRHQSAKGCMLYFNLKL